MLAAPLFKITINSVELIIKANLSVLEACKYAGFFLPRFCYHESLSVSGNCRMCLVELKNAVKPTAACVLPLANEMVIFTNTPLVLKARENILETLLIHHPLDCPICDQAGECDLQDQAVKFGLDTTRYYFFKRSVETKYLTPIISTIMTRCIHCTRCVRFSTEILGIESLGTLNRGGGTEIGNYASLGLFSEISGNVIDLCPVGALTSKNYSFKYRPWELRFVESIDLTDSLGSNIYINFKNINIARIMPKLNFNLNNNLITDNARYFFTALNSQRLLKSYTTLFPETVSQDKLLFYIKNYLKSQLTTSMNLIIVDEYLDLKSLQLAKILSYLKNIKVKAFKRVGIKTNLYILNSNNTKISDVNTIIDKIFLISCNLKIESAILNSKIRIKFLKADIQIYNLLGIYKLNYFAQFFNLNLNSFLQILEGKTNYLSELLLTSINSFFFIGETLFRRGLNCFHIITNLQKRLMNVRLLNISSGPNSEGVGFSNISNITKKDFIYSKQIFSLNVKETFQIYKYYNLSAAQISLYNTHGVHFVSKFVTTLLPLLPHFYSSYLYINLEGRAQKTGQIFPLVSETKNKPQLEITKELIDFLLHLKTLSPTTFASLLSFNEFNENLISNSNLFNQLTPVFGKLGCKFNQAAARVSLYPGKQYIEDFYLYSKLTVHSDLLAKCSTEIRSQHTNFSI